MIQPAETAKPADVNAELATLQKSIGDLLCQPDVSRLVQREVRVDLLRTQYTPHYETSTQGWAVLTVNSSGQLELKLGQSTGAGNMKGEGSGNFTYDASSGKFLDSKQQPIDDGYHQSALRVLQSLSPQQVGAVLQFLRKNDLSRLSPKDAQQAQNLEAQVPTLTAAVDELEQELGGILWGTDSLQASDQLRAEVTKKLLGLQDKLRSLQGNLKQTDASLGTELVRKHAAVLAGLSDRMQSIAQDIAAKGKIAPSHFNPDNGNNVTNRVVQPTDLSGDRPETTDRTTNKTTGNQGGALNRIMNFFKGK